MAKDVYGVILSSVNDARRRGWHSSELSLRCGLDVMRYLELSYADIAREHPVLTKTEPKVWGLPFDADTRLSRNQLVLVAPDGDVIGGAYINPVAAD